MMSYVRLFGDFRHSSCITGASHSAGQQVWFAPLVDEAHPEAPECILPADDGSIVQFRNRVVALDQDGVVRWERPRDSGMLTLLHNGVLYLRDAKGELTGLDARGDTVMSGFEPGACYDMCTLPLLYPRGENRFLMHTVNKAPEAEVVEDQKEEPDDYNLLSQGPGGWMDSDYMLEFEGKSLPAMVGKEGQRVVLLNYDHDVLTFDVATGRQINRFHLEDVGFWQASLDNAGDVVILLRTTEQIWKIVVYGTDGKQRWEYDLPASMPPESAQPPGVDRDNRILIVFGGEMLCLDKGTLQWKYELDRVDPIVRFTIQGDNSVLLAAQNRLHLIGPDGSGEPVVELQPGDWMTTPPVLDSRDRIIVGTVRGVYCY